MLLIVSNDYMGKWAYSHLLKPAKREGTMQQIKVTVKKIRTQNLVKTIMMLLTRERKRRGHVVLVSWLAAIKNSLAHSQLLPPSSPYVLHNHKKGYLHSQEKVACFSYACNKSLMLQQESMHTTVLHEKQLNNNRLRSRDYQTRLTDFFHHCCQ